MSVNKTEDEPATLVIKPDEDTTAVEETKAVAPASDIVTPSKGKKGGWKQDGKKPYFDNNDNIIRVSAHRPCNKYVFLSKNFLKESEEIQLQAFGNAISSAVLVSENLMR